MSCLFRSLAYFVKHNDFIVDENWMRSVICKYLETNPMILDNIKASDITNWESGKTLDEYVINMKNSSSWGGGIEIKAFCDIFNVKVIVNFFDKTIEFLPKNNKAIGTIELIYTGNHFEPKRK